MSYAVRVHCGGARDSFLLSRGVVQDTGDIEPGPVTEFETTDAAILAGSHSESVNAMGWHFSVEEYDEKTDTP